MAFIPLYLCGCYFAYMALRWAYRRMTSEWNQSDRIIGLGFSLLSWATLLVLVLIGIAMTFIKEDKPAKW